MQSLPYLLEHPQESSDQFFNRFYANALAHKIALGSPRLNEMVKRWKSDTTGVYLGPGLENNPELKSVLLAETPWVLDAKNEAAQRKNISLLFDTLRMNRELASTLEKLRQAQLSNGGFPWFKGGPDDRFITQYILTGLGRLKRLGALPGSLRPQIDQLVRSGIAYVDARLQEDYQRVLRSKGKPEEASIGYYEVQYLYLRSFFNEVGIPGKSFAAVNYYRKAAQQSWRRQTKFAQGMIALALDRTGDHKTAMDIIASLQQNAVIHEELGMYWKDNRAGYYWYQAPIETQSLLIEAFSEISKDTLAINRQKTWLLKQKQTNHWRSTKSTADACYALLLSGSDWIAEQPVIEVKLAEKTVNSSSAGEQAGTGYFKKVFQRPFVNPAMGNITVTRSGSTSAAPSWGAVYWQYFEKLDKISTASTPLKIKREIYIQHNSDRGPVLNRLPDGTAMKVGDKLIVRIQLTVDRDMEYIHLKDMRASCLEPINVLSGFKWQGGLGYYESTSDASTNFFFNSILKGNYVFEYPLFVAQTGNFSNGVTTVASIYAPEFSSHSEGIRLRVE